MLFQYRRMRAEDVPRCATILENDAAVREHYGDAISGLREVLRTLVCVESACALIWEVGSASGPQFVGFGVSIFISDAFADRLATPPYVWIGPEVVRRMMRGESPLLCSEELRKSNADGGLNLAALTNWVRPDFLSSVEVISGIMDAFLDQHRGYRIKQIFPQNEFAEFIRIQLRGGATLVDRDGSLSHPSNKAPEEFVNEPHCFRVTRELVQPGTWISTLFKCEEPQIFFSPSEQRLLREALKGRSDEDLSAYLHISLSGVKKTWRNIYERVGAELPELIRTDLNQEPVNGDRGKGKRQELLAYLRHHPEELRPLPRKGRASAA